MTTDALDSDDMVRLRERMADSIDVGSRFDDPPEPTRTSRPDRAAPGGPRGGVDRR